MIDAKKRFNRRAQRVRSKISRVSSLKLRFSVCKTNSYLYAQIIDDVRGCTLVSASSLEKAYRKAGASNSNKDAATWVGNTIAERAFAKGIDVVVFDKGGNKYHGVVKALADAARSRLNF